MTSVKDNLQTQIDLSCKQLKSTLNLMGIDLIDADPQRVSLLEEVLLSLKEMGDEAALSGASFMVGAYLGEMLRRELGGSYSITSENLLMLSLEGRQFFPVEKVRKFIENPDENGLSFYISAMLNQNRQ